MKIVKTVRIVKKLFQKRSKLQQRKSQNKKFNLRMIKSWKKK